MGVCVIHLASYHRTQNRITKQANGRITKKAGAMLLDSHLPSQLWPEAATATVYFTNQTPLVSCHQLDIYMWARMWGSSVNTNQMYLIYGCLGLLLMSTPLLRNIVVAKKI